MCVVEHLVLGVGVCELVEGLRVAVGCSTVTHGLLFPLHIPGSLVFMSSEWPALNGRFSLAALIIGSQGCLSWSRF